MIVNKNILPIPSDFEVVSLVNALNNCGLNIKTMGSSSGHGKSPLWVDIVFNDYRSIKNILLLIDVEFHDEFGISSDGMTIYDYNWDSDNFVLQLSTKVVGKEAYKLADDFAKVLVKYKNEWQKGDEEKDKKKENLLSNSKIKRMPRYIVYTMGGGKKKILVNDTIKNSKTFIMGHKLKKKFISFDGEHYLNAYLFDIKLNENGSGEKESFDISKFAEYRLTTLRKLKYLKSISDEKFESEIKKYWMIYDYSINDLDPEVKNLVNALNNCGLNIRTNGSCSGHIRHPLWITIVFNDYISLKSIILLNSIEFNNSFIISTDSRISNGGGMNSSDFRLQLSTRVTGEEAYKLADEFAKSLLKHKDEWRSKV